MAYVEYPVTDLHIRHNPKLKQQVEL